MIRTIQELDEAYESYKHGYMMGRNALIRIVGDPSPSNESEWQTFKSNRNNEAFLDRIYIVKVPYCLRVSEEIKIYEKLLRDSSLNDAPNAPGTLKIMAEFSVFTRLTEPENSSI